MGATPDGWWRDRQGAVMRLAGRLACHQQRSGDHIVLVLDVPQSDLPEELEVHFPRRRGRDAADEQILELLDAPERAPDTVVITSDRALAHAARQRGVEVDGARSFLTALDLSGC